VIKAVLFDIGGILEPNYSLADVSALLGIAEADLASHLRRDHVALTDGRMTLEAFYRRVVEASGRATGRLDPRHVLARHLEVYCAATSALDARVLGLIERLKARYRVACLTNTELEVARLNRDRGLFRPFHRAYLSTDLGLHKPDTAIFEHALRDLGCQASEAVFTDDKEANVEGAARAGLQVIHYRGFAEFEMSLHRVLRAGGVPPGHLVS
jgi:putative hydrolase of the HAD superfamily